MSAVYFLVTCAISICFAIPSNFVPFGTAEGDTRLTACDDCFSPAINFNFIFYGQNRTQLFVSNNGIISFNQGISQFTPIGMSAAPFPAIAVYWADVDTRSNANAGTWYGPRTNPTLLASLSAQISSTFHGVRAFVVTYDRVGYFSEHYDKINSMQAILIADAIGNSWVFLRYGGLQWTTGDASGGQNGLGGTPAVVGFSNGNGTYVQTPESLTSNVINTRDFLTQVNGVTIVLPACGNGIREGNEQCDGGNCCTSNCTFRDDDAYCYCSRQTLIGPITQQNYFCVPGNINKFYQCPQGPWAPQARIMNCAVGTTCGCPIGHECSCNSLSSPCVIAGSYQTC